MNEFEKIIAAKRAEHERLQHLPCMIHPKKNVAAPMARHTRPIDQADPGRIKELLMQEYDKSIAENLDKGEYMRLGYVSYIVASICGWLNCSILWLLNESHLSGIGTNAVMEQMLQASKFAHGRISVLGDDFVNQINAIRFVWMERGFSAHIKRLKNAFHNKILNSAFRYADSNANDLMAWSYTIVALMSDCIDNFIYSAEQYNRHTNGVVVPIPKKHNCIGYKLILAQQKLLSLCRWPKMIDSPDIRLCRQVVVNQLRLADILGIYNDLRQAELDAGKTIRIA